MKRLSRFVLLLGAAVALHAPAALADAPYSPNVPDPGKTAAPAQRQAWHPDGTRIRGPINVGTPIGRPGGPIGSVIGHVNGVPYTRADIRAGWRPPLAIPAGYLPYGGGLRWAGLPPTYPNLDITSASPPSSTSQPPSTPQPPPTTPQPPSNPPGNPPSEPPTEPPTAVPGPVGAAGLGALVLWARRLRQRIKSAAGRRIRRRQKSGSTADMLRQQLLRDYNPALHS